MVLGCLAAASFLAVVDTTIVSIALPTLREDLGFSAGQAHWALNSYTVVFGGLLLGFGRLADRFGRRRAFVAGLALFAGGSIIAAAAPLAWVLLVGRICQGVGAAAFVPSSLSLLTVTFTGRQTRGRALAVYGAMAGVGFVTGMVGGGAITELWGWRWIFLINVPAVAVILIIARLAFRATTESLNPARLDLAGAISITVASSAFVFAVTAGPHDGWTSPPTVVAVLILVAATASLALFESRATEPLLDRSLIRGARILSPLAAVACQSMVGIAWLYLLTLHFQDLLGLGPLLAGLAFAPMTVASIIGAAVAGHSIARYGTRPTMITGLAVMTLGLIILSLAMSAGGPLPTVIIGMMIGEAGFMLGSVALTLVITSRLPDLQSGLAAGLLNTATQLGGGIGLAIVAAVVAATGPPGAVAPSSLAAGFLTCLGFGLLACLFARSSAPLGRDDLRLGAPFRDQSAQ
jgi:EmrB/QacA subfamily drug resistance transporter